MEADFEMRVPSSTENLAMIRQFVGDIGERAGMEPKEVGKLQLAVDEACANVIEHAYSMDGTKRVSIRATFDQNAVEIDVIDTGKAFDPSSVKPIALEELIARKSPGGLGLRLIKTLMDEVHYHMIPGQKNELRMVKRLAKK
jgi:serine/threonine-protein kinase RsbW